MGRRKSCRQLFKQLQILPLPSQYIYSLLFFVNENKELFMSISEIHNINTRYKHNLHLLSTHLTLVHWSTVLWKQDLQSLTIEY